MRRVYKTKSVSEKTYLRIERAILRKELAPGQVLVINDLAERLGVSRTPVREALLLLEKAGLVCSENGRITVSDLSLDDLEEVFEVRQAIELFSIQKLVEREDLKQLKRIREALEAHRRPGNEAEAEAAAALDLKFHHTLVVSTGNARLVGVWDQVATELQRFWNHGKANLSRIRSDVEECLAVVAALEEGDGAQASKLLLDHLNQTKRALSAWQRSQASAIGSVEEIGDGVEASAAAAPTRPD